MCFGNFGIVSNMWKNSIAFGQFIKSLRENESTLASAPLAGIHGRLQRLDPAPTSKLSMDDIAAKGGPERHRLGIIERGQGGLSDTDFRQLDAAFRWPSGYAQSLLDFTVVATGLPAEDHADRQPGLGYLADEPRTLMAVPRDVVVQVPPDALVSIAHRWRGLTAIDVQAVGDLAALQSLARWWEDHHGLVVSTTGQVIGLKQVAIDPLPAIGSLVDARDMILAAEGLSEANVQNLDRLTRAAATLYWVAITVQNSAATGGSADVPRDGLTALTRLHQATRSYEGGQVGGWSAGYREFYASSELSSAAAEIDTDAERYVAGLLRARDRLTNIRSVVDDKGTVTWNPSSPETVPVNELTGNALVLYDSSTSPEVPTLLSWAATTMLASGGPALTIQASSKHRTSHAWRVAERAEPSAAPQPSAPPSAVPYGFTINVERMPTTVSPSPSIRSTVLDPFPVVNTLSGWDDDSRTAVFIEAGGRALKRLFIPPVEDLE